MPFRWRDGLHERSVEHPGDKPRSECPGCECGPTTSSLRDTGERRCEQRHPQSVSLQDVRDRLLHPVGELVEGGACDREDSLAGCNTLIERASMEPDGSKFAEAEMVACTSRALVSAKLALCVCHEFFLMCADDVGAHPCDYAIARREIETPEPRRSFGGRHVTGGELPVAGWAHNAVFAFTGRGIHGSREGLGDDRGFRRLLCHRVEFPLGREQRA